VKRRHLSFTVAVAVLAGLTAAAGPGAGASYAASADAGVPLPLPHFSHMVVDGPHGHVFISGGPGSDSLVVTDLDGDNPTTISGEPGATGLALSADGATLFAALPQSDAISAISTGTLAETARYATGAATRPDSLAVAGGVLWFGYGAAGAGGIGSVDPDGVVKLGQDSGGWAGPPMLATTPSASATLVGAVQDGAVSDLVSYKIVDGMPVRQAAAAVAVPDLTDFAVAADGRDVAVGTWYGVSHGTWLSTANLSPETGPGSPVELAPRAIAFAPDGTVAGCRCEGGEQVLDPPTGRLYQDVSVPRNTVLADHGLAWAPDSSRVYSVVVNEDDADDAGGAPVLRVMKDPEVAGVRFLLGSMPVTAPGEPYAITLTPFTYFEPGSENRGVLPGTLRITRYDDAHPNGVAVTDATVIPSNAVNYVASYRINSAAPLTGTFRYRVEYSGSTHYAPVDQTIEIPLARYAPDLVVSGPATSPRAAAYTVRGKLTWPHPHVNTGTVRVRKTDPAHLAGYSLATVPVAADGTFTLRDTPQFGGANSYAFSYDGGASYLPAAGTVKVDVSRAAPALTVTTDAASYHSGAAVKVTAHLGTTYNSRTVSVYAQPVGKARTLLRSGKADAHGNLAVSYKISRNTVFTASFGGDFRYAPRTVSSRTAVLAPTVTTDLQWPVGSTRIGSTTYRVFRKSEVNMGFDFKVSPTPAYGPSGGCASVYVEHYYSRAWHKVASQSCVPLYSDHWYGYGRALKLFATNGQYRIRGHFTPPAKGAIMGSVWTGWTYFVVHSG
jgi:hypothetical protein